LSIFFGVFGIDRFYLGYPTLGLAKLLTLGGFTIWSIIDMILIATTALRPADGTNYLNVPGRAYSQIADRWRDADVLNILNATEPI
jgi:TM2 domain-containing membrane protein YozV